ncbi:MAG: methyl-accepting chemotaxis protein [Candidatus Latescibacterota bacterium]
MQFMKSFRIDVKLMLALLTMTALLVLAGVIGFLGSRRVEKIQSALYSDFLPGIEYLLGTDGDLYRALGNERTLFLIEPGTNGFKRILTMLRADLAKADEKLKKYRALNLTPEERELLPELDEAWSEWQRAVDAAVDQYSIASPAGKSAAPDAALSTEPEKIQRVHEVLEQLAQLNLQSFERTEREAYETYHITGIALLIVIMAGLLIGFGIFWVLGRRVIAPLQKIIERLTVNTGQLYTASNQICESSREMARGAAEQTSSIEEISSSLEEMTAMTRQNAENARQSSAMVREAQRVAEKGTLAMRRMHETIDRIKVSSDETAKIMKTIDEIAFQTNLLALNAAVEAARAGEAGAGFAVVADEVRNLAQRAAEAARITSDLIEGSRMNAMEGVDASREVGEILSVIAETAGKMTCLIGEVSTASNEQAQGISLLNDSVAQMDQITQANAVNAEESASAGSELSAQAEDLSRMIEALVAIVGGAAPELDVSEDEYFEEQPEPADLSEIKPGGCRVRAADVEFKRRVSPEIICPEDVIPFDKDEFEEF